ncbi:MAG: Processive diacylglycerol beta-glucosyltransferase [Chlamydiae bacterium]|nr:Processive diacylglycerol beta-glucosyltransferase [Chlamydiota bacterium]
MRRKKLLILSSYGGYGHIAAANTLTALLGDQYEIEVVYPIKDLRIMGIPSGESIYNFLLSNNLMRTNNFMVRYLAPPALRAREEKMARLIEKYIDEKKPDLLVSVVCYVNYPASEAAHRSGIPFLLVTVDYDMHNYMKSMDKMRCNDFKVTISGDLPSIRESLLQHRISEASIEPIGLPLRTGFLEAKNKDMLREKYEIPQGKRVVLVMFGGVGSKYTYRYAEAIAATSSNLHLVVCAGRNGKLAEKLQRIQPAAGNSIDIVPFTEKIDELFAVSDLLVTKPGPGTITEAMRCKLPILIDRMSTPLFWEEANIELVLSNKVGACIHTLDEIPELLNRYFYDEVTKRALAEAYQRVSENHFAEKIVPLIEDMVSDPIGGEVAMTSRSFSPNSL